MDANETDHLKEACDILRNSEEWASWTRLPAIVTAAEERDARKVLEVSKYIGQSSTFVIGKYLAEIIDGSPEAKLNVELIGFLVNPKEG